MKHEPIVVEQTFNAPVKEVWKAITELDQMKQWYFDVIDAFKPEVGSVTRFTIRLGDKVYPHVWKVTEVVPGKRIVYDWTYEGYPGYSSVAFDLFPKNRQTSLRLTHSGIESFPQDNPDFSRESGVGGWTFLIKKRLKEFLESKKGGTFEGRDSG